MMSSALMIADEQVEAWRQMQPLPAAPVANENCRRRTAAWPSTSLAGTVETGETEKVISVEVVAVAAACLTPSEATAAGNDERRQLQKLPPAQRKPVLSGGLWQAGSPGASRQQGPQLAGGRKLQWQTVETARET